MRSEKVHWTNFRTGVQLPSSPLLNRGVALSLPRFFISHSSFNQKSLADFMLQRLVNVRSTGLELGELGIAVYRPESQRIARTLCNSTAGAISDTLRQVATDRDKKAKLWHNCGIKSDRKIYDIRHIRTQQNIIRQQSAEYCGILLFSLSFSLFLL